ncbi:hypothetical protein JL721_1685 [Aureococcus anophagefferens]|nr:hypothetical protein JL721_1685 [Aureococcus anophagefferens]
MRLWACLVACTGAQTLAPTTPETTDLELWLSAQDLQPGPPFGLGRAGCPGAAAGVRRGDRRAVDGAVRGLGDLRGPRVRRRLRRVGRRRLLRPRVLAELVANCTAACGGCAPSAAPTAPRGDDGDDGDDDLNSENAVMVGGGVLVVVLCVFCCFKLLPHLEYERAKHNNKLYPGTVMVVKPASPGRVAPLMFGPESYDIPTPNQQRKASERATKHLSVEHKNRVTAMIEHDRKRAEEQAKEDLELLDVVPSPKAPGERRSVAVATPLSHGGAGRRGTAGRGRMMPT